MAFRDFEVETLCRDPGRQQRSALRTILGENQRTRFCREHGIGPASSLAEYQRRVPIRRHDELAPYIDRMRAGERGVLLDAPVVMFARTAGTSSAPKHIPVSRASIRAQQAAQWLLVRAALHDVPAAGAGRILILTAPTWDGSIGTLGFGRDGALDGKILLAPEAILRMDDLAARQQALAAHAQAHDVSMLLATVPSWLLSLLEHFTAPVREAWPRLACAAVWCTSSSSLYLPRLRAVLGDAAIRDVGFVASEGYFAVPIGATSAALPLAHHVVFEFFAGDATPKPHALTMGLDDLDVGRQYRVIVTTPGGLYRYDLEDIVEVVERMGQMPLIQFVRRAGGVVSAAGENVTEEHVVTAMRRAARELDLVVHDFVAEVVFRDARPPRYHFVVAVDEPERPWPSLAPRLDAALGAANDEYRWRRDAGWLAPPKVELVTEEPFRQLRQARVDEGTAEAHVKLLCLRVPPKGPAVP